MIRCVDQLNESGANKVYAWATHGVFGKKRDVDGTVEKLQKCEAMKYLLISNTVKKEFCYNFFLVSKVPKIK